MMETIHFNYEPFKRWVPHDRISQFHVDALDFVISMYTTTEKLALLTYEEISQAKDDYEKHFSNQLSAALKRRLYDCEYGQPFILTEALDYLNLKYKSSITFKRLLANGKVPAAHVLTLLEFIEKEYRVKR